MNFNTFNFHPNINSSIEEQGFATPTPIQEQTIPHALKKKDILGIAQTGTGKTAAFVLPILEHLMTGPRGKVRALIIAPTRELAIQIEGVLKNLGKETGVKSVLIIGGINIKPQIKRINAGVDVIVACPGRLLDHIERRTIKLSTVEMLVLDEADQMFDMGFLPAIKQIVKKLPVKRQTLLFSATMPDDIRKLANQILSNPITIEVGRIAPPQTIEHSLYPVAPAQKINLLEDLLKTLTVESILVFTRTKHRAKRLAVKLSEIGYSVSALQGNLSQNRRTEAINGFKSGKYKVLVATDIAARGIDISSISHVINYDVPSTAETYTHRIGRTGRASKKGEAFTLISNEDSKMIRAIEKLLGKEIERRELKDFPYQKDTSSTEKTPQNNSNRPPRSRSPRQNSRSQSSRNQSSKNNNVKSFRNSGNR